MSGKNDNEFIKNLADKGSEILAKIMEFFDGISQKIFDKTGKKIPVGELVVGVVTLIIVLIVALKIVKSCFAFLT